MNKETVVETLKEIADLLEISGASQFEFRAFRNAAAGLDDWDGDLGKAIEDNCLTSIPSIGKGTATVVSELIQNGKSNELQRVRKLIPDELPKLLRFRGLGPKRVRTLWQELDIESPHDLEAAINDGRVAKLKGFGTKTIENMLASIEYFRNRDQPTKAPPELAAVPLAIASSGSVFAGTSGYSYPAWKGSFYPEKAKTEDLLKHYADQLAAVEINNTFYRFPSAKVVEQWKSHTSADFQFALKVHRRVTHQMRLNRGTAIRIQEFVDRCSVLGSRLGCILFQLPPDFERNDERLSNLLMAVPDGPRYAIEFRHPSWIHDQVFEQLRKKNVACVCGDSAENEPAKYVTADFVYARLRKDSYDKLELDDWNCWIEQQRSKNRDVLIFLKHDDTGAAPTEITKRWPGKN